MTKLHTLLLFVIGAVGAFWLTGCAYTTKGQLPENIKTIEVNTFGNTTNYLSLEGILTREIITRANLTPGLKVVNSKGDATLTGTIYEVRKVTSVYDGNNQPSAQMVVIKVRIQLQDNRTGDFIIANREIVNSQSSSSSGVLRLDEGQTWTSARDAALSEVAKLIVRSFYDKW